ncbi:MAG: OB-fold nucleic acid binding domain-containing protein, partial [Candidatus Berkelbacteria bacterium]|nr:OB-fold nucleic acid binding domain-containing protein [Candidatus Berkelbacteria bacterium]
EGDSINLLWPDGSLCSGSQEYKNADIDMSWSRNIDNNWLFSTTATSGRANIFTSKQEEIQNFPVAPIEKAKKQAKNEWVKISGVVIVEPGLFGKRVMYIQDESGGIKIYFDKALWPSLKIGDRVIIYGKISISLGEYQIKVYGPEDIVIIGLGPPPEPAKKKIIELNDFIGQLMKVSGRVVKISGSTIWIDDGTGELRVYFYPATGIKKLGLEEGNWVTIIGILSKTSAGLRLLPRSKNDVKIFENEKKEASTLGNSLINQVLGVENVQAASDYRTINDDPKAIKPNNIYKIWGAVLLVLGFLLLATLLIFARIRKKYAKDNQFF